MCLSACLLPDPAFVLITGDMIHGYEVESSFTPNYEAQWNWYSRVRQALSVNNLTAIDMLGNHDTIGLIGLDSNPFFSEKRGNTSSMGANFVTTVKHGDGMMFVRPMSWI